MNVIRKLIALLLASLVLSTGAALAQVEPEAAKWLERAREAHGGNALASLETLHESSLITYYGPDGQPVAEITGVALIDLADERLRIEVYSGEELVMIQQITPERSATWAPQSGTINLPAAQAKELSDTLWTSYYSLRLGGEGREAAQLEENVTWGEVTGQAVEVTTNGKTTTYLLADDGTMLAERYFSATIGTDMTVFYEDFRTVDGLKLPFAVHAYVGDITFYSAETQNIEVNVEFADEDFALP